MAPRILEFYFPWLKQPLQVPELGREEQNKVLDARKVGKLEAMKAIRHFSGLGLRESLEVVESLNEVYGICPECETSGMEGKNRICSGCGRFWLNWDTLPR